MPRMRGAWMLAIGLIVLAIAGCSGPAAQSSENQDAAAQDSAAVSMQNVAFSPKAVTVKVGATVTWINQDSMGHTVTPADKAQWGTDGSGDGVSEWLQRGQSWSHTFTQPGTYEYYCKPHASMGSSGDYQGMVGVVHVEA